MALSVHRRVNPVSSNNTTTPFKADLFWLYYKMLTLHGDAVNNLLICLQFKFTNTRIPVPSQLYRRCHPPKPSENKPTDWRKATLGNSPLGVIFESALDCLVCFSATTMAFQLQTASLLKVFKAAGSGSGGRTSCLLNGRFVVRSLEVPKHPWVSQGQSACE